MCFINFVKFIFVRFSYDLIKFFIFNYYYKVIIVKLFVKFLFFVLFFSSQVIALPYDGRPIDKFESTYLGQYYVIAKYCGGEFFNQANKVRGVLKEFSTPDYNIFNSASFKPLNLVTKATSFQGRPHCPVIEENIIGRYNAYIKRIKRIATIRSRENNKEKITENELNYKSFCKHRSSGFVRGYYLEKENCEGIWESATLEEYLAFKGSTSIKQQNNQQEEKLEETLEITKEITNDQNKEELSKIDYLKFYTKDELEDAKNFINDALEFYDKNKEAFDLVEFVKLISQSKSILDADTLSNQQKEDFSKLKLFVNKSENFKSFHLSNQLSRDEFKINQVKNKLHDINLGINNLINFLKDNVTSKYAYDISKKIESSQLILENPKSIKQIDNLKSEIDIFLIQLKENEVTYDQSVRMKLLLELFLEENILSTHSTDVVKYLEKLKNFIDQEEISELKKLNDELDNYIIKNEDIYRFFTYNFTDIHIADKGRLKVKKNKIMANNKKVDTEVLQDQKKETDTNEDKCISDYKIYRQPGGKLMLSKNDNEIDIDWWDNDWNWKYIEKVKNEKICVDLNTIKKSGDTVTFFKLNSFPYVNEKNEGSIVYQTEMNCKSGEFKYLNAVMYPGFIGDGDPSTAIFKSSKVYSKDVLKENYEYLFDFVCNFNTQEIQPKTDISQSSANSNGTNDFEIIKSSKPVSMDCTYSADARALWKYDGTTVSYNLLPLKLGKHKFPGANEVYELKKMNKKDSFEFIFQNGLMFFEIDFNQKKSSMSTFIGTNSPGVCY